MWKLCIAHFGGITTMGLLSFLSGRNEAPNGMIRYHGLTDWWLSAVSEAERKHICDIYSPMGEETKSLVTGNISQSTQSCLAFLTNLSDWFDNPRDRQLSIRILEKAEAVLPQCTDVLDRHFFYARKMKLYYKLRDSDPTALDKAIEAGNAQIAIAPDAAAAFKRESSSPQLPKHPGFTQMCIILQKQKNYTGVIALAEEAKRQGWNDEWDKRIAKARSMMGRS